MLKEQPTGDCQSSPKKESKLGRSTWLKYMASLLAKASHMATHRFQRMGTYNPSPGKSTKEKNTSNMS